MRKLVCLLPALLCAGAMLPDADAQPPRGKAKEGGPPLVERLMAMDKNKDGKLSKDEVTDERLQRLFDLADANKDGVVTREELAALAKQLDADDEEGDRRGFRGKGKGGFEGKRGGRGEGGPGGFGGPPRPGQILPPPLQERLGLSVEQKKQFDALQKEVDDRLAKILTADQKKRLEVMRQGPPGSRGPSGRGFGGPPKDRDR